ncbi:MAG: M20/M25/M40 family metallo-hydrolase [Candidatus Acidiferrales bacterium]
MEAYLQQDATQSSGSILSAIAVLGLILFLSLEGLRPPAPKPITASATEFSAERAREILYRLVGDGIPHPTGSPQNDVVRGRVMDEFSNLGYQPAVQQGVACDEYGGCATVNNVVARLEGSEPGDSVLAAAHYDSVAAGPGAFDDGAGAATVLECARAFKTLQQPKHSIIFLVDDGEEAGLLGARAFVAQHPWAKDVRVAVNVESRGTTGPSLMFETGDANEWALRAYALRARRPATSSIFYEGYKRIPNDTDFTIFKAAGYQGVNFANIGGVVHYHTPLDNFANANASTLQHQGDNALGSLEAFANQDISNPPRDSAVYFDVFGRWIFWWPAAWALKIAIFSALLLFVEIAWLIYKKRLSGSEFLWGLFAWFVAMLAVGVLALALSFILRHAGATASPWVAHPSPAQISFWSLAILVVALLSIRFASRAGFLGLWAGVWTWWTVFGIAIASNYAAVGYILQVTTCAAAVVGLLLVFRPQTSSRAATLAVVVPLAIGATLGFVPALLLYQAFGNPALPGIALLVGLLCTPMAPLCADRNRPRGISVVGLPALAGIATVIAVFAAIVAPVFSAKSPEHVNLEYVQEADSGRSQWVVYPASGRLPESLGLATNFRRQETGPYPWIAEPSFVVSAPHLDLPPPTFTILELSAATGKRMYRALLRSERGAPEAGVLFPPDSGIESVSAENEALPPESEKLRRRVNGWYVFHFSAMPAKGVELRFTLPAGKAVEVYALDTTYSLPLEGLFLQKARPLTAVPYGSGDRTIISRRVELLP